MLAAHGTAVFLDARHLCTQMRGVREHEPTTRTTAYRGAYVADPALRAEFFTMTGIGAQARKGTDRMDVGAFANPSVPIVVS